MVIKEYDLQDANFRKEANDFGFICNLGGKRYKICLDKPGFCRISYKNGFLGIGKKKIEEYVPAVPYQYLIDANLKCFNKDEYPFE